MWLEMSKGSSGVQSCIAWAFIRVCVQTWSWQRSTWLGHLGNVWLMVRDFHWFWSLQFYDKEVHIWQCFLSVLACSKFLENEISAVSELVMTWNSSDASHSVRMLLHFCIAVLCPETVTLQEAKVGATAVLQLCWHFLFVFFLLNPWECLQSCQRAN